MAFFFNTLESFKIPASQYRNFRLTQHPDITVIYNRTSQSWAK